jgi:hypothetical protein
MANTGDNQCTCTVHEVDTSEFEEKKLTDPTIAAYKDALEKLTGVVKKASQSSDGKELSDDYWKEVSQLLKKAKLGISMKELGIDDESDPVGTTNTDTKIKPMGDTRDGDQQFDVAKDEEEAMDAEEEKEKEEKKKAPSAKKPEPESDTERDSEQKTEALNEKAKSAAQQRLFGMVHAYQTGELDKNEVSASLWEKIKKIADGISNKDAEDFAKTKHDDLPEKVPTEESTKQLNKLDEIRHLGIILESDDYKVISATNYREGYIMEVKLRDNTYLLSIADDVVLEGAGYTYILGDTSNFAKVVDKFKKLTSLTDYELIQRNCVESKVSVL